MSESQIPVESICITCGRGLRRSRAREAIGFCPSCAGKMGWVPVEDLRGLSSEEVDRLPVGFIGLDDEGYVLRFNAYEARASGRVPQSVLGRHFFREVAPCTSIQAFEGRYARMVRQGLPAAAGFRYLFRFAGGDRLMNVFLSYRPDKGEGLVILRELGCI
jgi:photoactive yellow protein